MLLNTYGANKGLDGGTILLFTSNKPCLTANPNLGCSKWVPDFAKEHNVKFKVYYFNPVSFDRAYLKENYLGLKKNLFVSGTGYDAKVVLKLIRAFANDYYTNELTNHGTNPLSDVNSKVMNISLEDLNATAFVSDADPVPNRILDIITQLTTAGFTNKPNWTRMVQANGVTTNDLDTLISRYAYFYNNMFGTKLVTFEWFH